MSFFEANKQSTNDPFFDALVSYTETGTSVSSVGALRNSDIFSAINIIASDVASNEVFCDTPLLTKIVNYHPNDYMDGWHFKYALCANMLLNGNAYALIEDAHTLKFIPNSKIEVLQDDVTGEVFYNYTSDEKKKCQIASDKILHFKYATTDGVIGISPLYSLSDERTIQKTGNRLLKDFFDSGILGTKVLKVHNTSISDEGKRNIASRFEAINKGKTGVIALDEDMDLQNLEINTDILKLVNSNDWTTKQIAKAFGLPPEKLGVENVHSNQEMSNLQYLQGSLQKYFDCFTSELSFKFGNKWEFDTSKLLSLDPTTKQNNAIQGYVNGILTLNEAREQVGMEKVPNGDTCLLPNVKETDN